MNLEINLSSNRARKARFTKRFAKFGLSTVYIVALVVAVIAILCFTRPALFRLGFLTLAISLYFFMFVVWFFWDLKDLKPSPKPQSLDDVISAKLLARLKDNLTPKMAFDTALKLWPGRFMINHLYISPSLIESNLTDNQSDMAVIWQTAYQLMQKQSATEIGSGTLVTALIISSPSLIAYLTRLNLRQAEVLEVYSWLERLQTYLRLPKPNFGGIGRDWASGYAPVLERFSSNISRSVEFNGAYSHFLSHQTVLTGIIHSLDRNAPVALVGPPGIGKTELIHGLAERLLEGKDPALQHYQIISLNASSILSGAGGQLEAIMLTLFSDAIHAGNLIMFLDEAQLFFGHGTGAFDLAQILLPIIQNRSIKIIAAFPPNSWQQLRASNETLASSFATINLTEPPAEDTLKIMEDFALLVESRDHLIVTWESIREAYRLSGQYMEDLSYPGKAINLIDQSIVYADNGVMTETSVQTAIEKTKGIKATTAGLPEANKLIHLEELIHARMIDQSRAVNVVSAALRRGRAGVSNPKRPLGSFLFLGPTGVGKTELARSIAAVYFDSETNMIRLDMSEYQRPEDVARLLTPSSTGEKSLLMQLRQQPFSVVLLDEIEKAHPQILNLLLQMLDEGQLTDESGKPASFRSSIVIATSNAGANDIIDHVRSGKSIADLEKPLIDQLIKNGIFKPELINRFDEVVLFAPLGSAELAQVANLMLNEVNKTLAQRNITVKLTDAALAAVIKSGYSAEFGARPLRRVIQRTVEDAIANMILSGQANPGSVVTLNEQQISEYLAKSS